MQDREFHDLVDKTVEQLEDELDELDADLDIDSSGGVLNVGFPDGSAIVLSRQPSALEIWIAAKSGGFHLQYLDDQWYCQATNESLSMLIGRVFSEQLGYSVNLLAS